MISEIIEKKAFKFHFWAPRRRKEMERYRVLLGKS